MMDDIEFVLTHPALVERQLFAGDGYTSLYLIFRDDKQMKKISGCFDYREAFAMARKWLEENET